MTKLTEKIFQSRIKLNMNQQQKEILLETCTLEDFKKPHKPLDLTKVYDSNKELFQKTSNQAMGCIMMKYVDLFILKKDYERALEYSQISINIFLRAHPLKKIGNIHKKLVLYFWKQSYAYFQLSLESKDRAEVMKLYRKTLCSSFRSICLSNCITYEIFDISRLPSDFLKPTILDFDLTKLNLKSNNFLETLCRAGHFLLIDGKRSISLKYFAKALLVQREIDPQDYTKISQILNQSAMGELLEKNHEVALKLIKESVKLTSYLSDRDFDTTSHSYYIYGRILFSMSKINSNNQEATYQNSLSCFEHSLKILESGSVEITCLNKVSTQKMEIKKIIIEVKSKLPSRLQIVSDFLLKVVTSFWPQ